VCGSVGGVDVATAATHCFTVRRFQDSGRSLGYAHVDFATPAAAADAVAKDGQYLLGRFLSVEYAKPKRSQKGAPHAKRQCRCRCGWSLTCPCASQMWHIRWVRARRTARRCLSRTCRTMLRRTR
jgi:hypothetical protein